MAAFRVKDELWEERAKALLTGQVSEQEVAQEVGAGSGPQACPSVETGAATSSPYANAFKRGIIRRFGELRKTGELF